jgi:hypothetical protein
LWLGHRVGFGGLADGCMDGWWVKAVLKNCLVQSKKLCNSFKNKVNLNISRDIEITFFVAEV